MTLYLTKSGIFIPFDHLQTHDDSSTNILVKKIKKIKNYFTLRSMQLVGHAKIISCVKIDRRKKRIIIPRFGMDIFTDKKIFSYVPKIKNCLPEGKSIHVKWKGTLLPNQRYIIDYLTSTVYDLKRVNNGQAGCILQLDAGQGKSYIASWLISHIKGKTAIIVHSTSILHQWYTVLTSTLADVSIGYYYGKKKQDGDIVIILINSAKSAVFRNKAGIGKSAVYTEYTPIEFFSRFRFCIYDEAHLYSNKTGLAVLKVAQTPYMLGLSATPDEHVDKFDKAVWWNIGSIVRAIDIPGYTHNITEFTGIVHKIEYKGGPAYTKLLINPTTGMTSVTETISMICSDPQRTKCVLDCIQKCLQKKMNTFVFADRKEYLNLLMDKLRQINIVDDSRIDILTTADDYIRIVGGAKNEELLKAEKAKVIFTTYQYMGTGKSIKKMNALVLATPRKSKMKQYIKRIFRLGSDTSITRIIYDIVDCRTILRSQWYTRCRYYKSQNFQITVD